MRRRKRESAMQTTAGRDLSSHKAGDAIRGSAGDFPADWRELGRRVLAEAMRRSMRELRRRNGCAAGRSIYRGRGEELS
jgi:hypothetical protein